MRSSKRIRTEADYHYWLTIALISVFFFWLLVNKANAEAAPAIQTLPEAPSHRFVSKSNVTLWAVDGAAKALDGIYTARTMNNGYGGTEQDPIARPFVHGPVSQGVYFGASLAGDIALSYLFHKTGHHKLEKAVLFVGIGNSASCAGYTAANYQTYPSAHKVPYVKEQF